MKNLSLANGKLQASVISLGCMRISGISETEAENVVKTALENGINFFDHADIYGGNGKCEEVFAKAANITPQLREKLYLQSKCGIRNGYFDFSEEHILASVDGSLSRLNTEYLDVLLLHRPDSLMEPEEVASAFDKLQSSGKVRHFGVSNQNPSQIELLRKFVKQPILFNQLQLSVTNTGMIDSGFNVNTKFEIGIDRDGSVLEYSRLHEITIQAWSPFQYGFFEGAFLDNEKFPELNAKINEIAEKYNVANTTIATAWILRHPANMQVVIGTMNAGRITDICKASDVNLTRPEWYEIYRAAGNKLP